MMYDTAVIDRELNLISGLLSSTGIAFDIHTENSPRYGREIVCGRVSYQGREFVLEHPFENFPANTQIDFITDSPLSNGHGVMHNIAVPYFHAFYDQDDLLEVGDRLQEYGGKRVMALEIKGSHMDFREGRLYIWYHFQEPVAKTIFCSLPMDVEDYQKGLFPYHHPPKRRSEHHACITVAEFPIMPVGFDFRTASTVSFTIDRFDDMNPDRVREILEGLPIPNNKFRVEYNGLSNLGEGMSGEVYVRRNKDSNSKQITMRLHRRNFEQSFKALFRVYELIL